MDDRDPREDIRRYGERASSGWIDCDLERCPRCQGYPREFQWHGVRRRVFLVFVFGLVEAVASRLTRWKCVLCSRTFTLYPGFALPYKRYVLVFIQARCAGYVEDAGCSYRTGVQEGGEPIFYRDPDRGAVLPPSTLWRWVTSLGSLPATVRQALVLVKQKDPSTGIFRTLGTLRVAAHKFRSPPRQRILVRCLHLVHVESVYAALFGVSVFPELATGCGWG
jgi:hypothetical protein